MFLIILSLMLINNNLVIRSFAYMGDLIMFTSNCSTVLATTILGNGITKHIFYH